MKWIYNILERVHRMQTSCFNTPVGVCIEASKDTESKEETKVISVAVTAKGTQKRYFISSDMTKDEYSQEWGRLKDDVDKLLNELVGKRINAHGREKKG